MGCCIVQQKFTNVAQEYAASIFKKDSRTAASAYFSTLKMDALCSSKMLVNFYHAKHHLRKWNPSQSPS
jgi:hypothetical protein